MSDDNESPDVTAINSVKQIGQISITRTSRSIDQLSVSARRWVAVGIIAAIAHLICYVILTGGAWWFQELHMYGVGIYHLLTPFVFMVVVLSIFNIGNTNVSMPVSARFLVIVALGFVLIMFVVSGVYMIKVLLTMIECFGVNAVPPTIIPTTNTTSIVPGSTATVLCSGLLYTLFWLTSIKALLLMLLEGLIFIILLVLLSRVNTLNDALLRRKWAINCAEVGKKVSTDVNTGETVVKQVITTEQAHDILREIHKDYGNHGLHIGHLLVSDNAHEMMVLHHLGNEPSYAMNNGYSTVNNNRNGQEDQVPLINNNNHGYNNTSGNGGNNKIEFTDDIGY